MSLQLVDEDVQMTWFAVITVEDKQMDQWLSAADRLPLGSLTALATGKMPLGIFIPYIKIHHYVLAFCHPIFRVPAATNNKSIL